MFDKKTKTINKNNILMIIIIVLLVIIAVLAFFLWKNSSSDSNVLVDKTNMSEEKTNNDTESLVIEVIGDKRSLSMELDTMIEEMKKTPSIGAAKIVKKDFSDEGVEEFLKENDIKALPALIFSTKNFDWSKDPQNIKLYLEETSDSRYSLKIGADYNPFGRDENGFLTLDKEINIIWDSYVKWNKDAQITLIEYTDLQCPACISFHKSGYLENLTGEFWDSLNFVVKHFPLDFHPNAKPAAEIAECLWAEKWSEAFYNLIERIFSTAKSDKEFVLEEAVKLWGNKQKLESCLKEAKFAEKVENDQKVWTGLFNISGTPTLIILNNKTGKYEKATRNIELDKKIVEKLK